MPCTQLLIYQERHPGFQFRAGDWPAKLIRKEHRWVTLTSRALQGPLSAFRMCRAGSDARLYCPCLTACPSHAPTRSYLDMLEQMTRMERERRLQQVLELQQVPMPEKQRQQEQPRGDAQPLLTFMPRQVAAVFRPRWLAPCVRPDCSAPGAPPNPCSVELNELVRPADRCVPVPRPVGRVKFGVKWGGHRCVA